MRKDITHELTLENSLHTPVPVTLTEKVAFFIIRGDVALDEKLFTAAITGGNDNIVYCDSSLIIRDFRDDRARVLDITVDTPSQENTCTFDFYGGDFVIINPNHASCSGYVFLPYLNLFYRIGGLSEIEIWAPMSNELRCIAAIHDLCSKLILVSKTTPEEDVMYELRNLQKLACAWTDPNILDGFDWEKEARSLLDKNVVPKIKKFAVNTSHRRIRLD
jgi:hypothetical protein